MQSRTSYFKGSHYGEPFSRGGLRKLLGSAQVSVTSQNVQKGRRAGRSSQEALLLQNSLQCGAGCQPWLVLRREMMCCCRGRREHIIVFICLRLRSVEVLLIKAIVVSSSACVFLCFSFRPCVWTTACSSKLVNTDVKLELSSNHTLSKQPMLFCETQHSAHHFKKKINFNFYFLAVFSKPEKFISIHMLHTVLTAGSCPEKSIWYKLESR